MLLLKKNVFLNNKFKSIGCLPLLSTLMHYLDRRKAADDGLLFHYPQSLSVLWSHGSRRANLFHPEVRESSTSRRNVKSLDRLKIAARKEEEKKISFRPKDFLYIGNLKCVVRRGGGVLSRRKELRMVLIKGRKKVEEKRGQGTK